MDTEQLKVFLQRIAMDALACAARVEAEGVQTRSQAEAELVRVRAEDESSHQESRRFRRHVEQGADVKSADPETDLVRLRAEAAQQESRRSRRFAQEAAEARAAAAEAELAHLRAEIEQVRHHVDAELAARLRSEAEARAPIEARAAAEYPELEPLRSESSRLSVVKQGQEQPALSGSLPVNQPSGVAASSRAPSSASSSAPSSVPSSAPSSVPSSVPSLAPSQARNTSGSLLTTLPSSAYQFSLGDNLMLILSADNLRGETLCTAARLIGISAEGELTIDCAEPVSAPRWNQKTVMIGKNPHNGSLLVAETKISFIDDNDENIVRLSNPDGRLLTVQLRSSVRQRAERAHEV